MEWPVLTQNTLWSDNASFGEDMKISWVKIALLALCCAALGFELWHFKGGSTATRQSSATAAPKNQPGFVLLPADQLEIWNMHVTPAPKVDSWEPTLGDMNDAEGALDQITALSENDPDPNRHIDNPREYHRQYLAASIDGKEKIYLNALCSIDQNVEWHKNLIVVSDGGRCFWHAMYDPATQRYSDLVVNGRA